MTKKWELKPLPCPDCGREHLATRRDSLCDDCRAQRTRELARLAKARKKERLETQQAAQRMSDLSAIARQAQEKHMTYGQLVASEQVTI